MKKTDKVNNKKETGSPKKVNRIFLGGTCNSDWRTGLIHALDYYEMSYFNPVVNDWTPECIEIENEEKYNKCNIHLYYIDSSMTGVYSIAEVVDSAYRTMEHEWCDICQSYHKSLPTDFVIFIVNESNFSEGQLRSLRAVSLMVKDITQFCYCKTCNDSNMVDTILGGIREAEKCIEAMREAYDDDYYEYDD